MGEQRHPASGNRAICDSGRPPEALTVGMGRVIWEALDYADAGACPGLIGGFSGWGLASVHTRALWPQHRVGVGKHEPGRGLGGGWASNVLERLGEWGERA